MFGRQAFAGLLTLVALWPLGAAAAEWRLMGREGGCVEIARAAERMDFLLGIQGPEQLANRLTRRGEVFSRQDIVQGGRRAVMFEIPERGMSLIFVPPSICR